MRDLCTVWYQREGTSMELPCVTPTNTETLHKHQGAMYLWRDSRGRSVQSSRATVFGNGSMYFDSVLAPDSNTYYCDVHLSDDTQRTHVHTIIGLYSYVKLNDFSITRF